MKPLFNFYGSLRTVAGWVWIAGTLFLSCQSAEKDATSQAHRSDTVRIDTTARIVYEVNKCARLYTTEYVIHKIVTHTDNPTLRGNVLGIPVNMHTRVGNRKVAIPIDVKLKAYIDFAEFSEKNIERTDTSITVTLPDPKIIATASKVDHRGTRQFIDGMRSRYTDEEISNFAHQGADSIISHAASFGIIEQAEMSAAASLHPMLTKMGFKEKNITIRFRKKFTESDVAKIIVKQ